MVKKSPSLWYWYYTFDENMSWRVEWQEQNHNSRGIPLIQCKMVPFVIDNLEEENWGRFEIDRMTGFMAGEIHELL